MSRVSYLEEYLKEHEPSLFQDYQDIINDAVKIWDPPRLLWFTDHGPGHSGNIIFHLDRLCQNLLYVPHDKSTHDYGLVPEEVFLLLAAAWLHDIGMQDFSGLGECPAGKHEWDLVRKEHPKRTFDIIMDYASGGSKINDFRLSIDDSQLPIAAPLALICRGHGSDYFEDTLREIEFHTFNIGGKGVKIRAGLLTALLLIADELDLHCNRAFFRPNFPLSRVSRLHHFRHHYISNVEVVAGFDGKPGTPRTIHITFSFPQDDPVDKAWQEQLKRWIREKLEKEAKRTADHLYNGFAGHFSWGKTLLVFKDEPALEKAKRVMDKPVRDLLAAQFQKVIDWKEITRQLTLRFQEKQGGVVLLNAGKEKGIDCFIDFIESIFLSTCETDYSHPPSALLEFSGLHNYHSAADVLEVIYEYLAVVPPANDHMPVIDRLLEENGFYLVIFKNLDASGKDFLREVKETIIDKCAQKTRNLLLLVTSSKEEPLFNGLDSLILPAEFEEKDIRAYFQERGDSPGLAALKARECIDRAKKQQDNPSPLVFIQAAGKVDAFLEDYKKELGG